MQENNMKIRHQNLATDYIFSLLKATDEHT